MNLLTTSCTNTLVLSKSMISITKADLLQDNQVELEIHHQNENIQILKLKAL